MNSVSVRRWLPTAHCALCVLYFRNSASTNLKRINEYLDSDALDSFPLRGSLFVDAMSKLFSQCYSPLGNAEGKNNLQMTAPITIFQKVNDADWVSAAADTILVIGMAVLVVAGVWIVSGRRAGLQKT